MWVFRPLWTVTQCDVLVVIAVTLWRILKFLNWTMNPFQSHVNLIAAFYSMTKYVYEIPADFEVEQT